MTREEALLVLADEILALVNSRPSTPSREEIAAALPEMGREDVLGLADRVLGLINSKPGTPSRNEIAALIGELVPAAVEEADGTGRSLRGARYEKGASKTLVRIIKEKLHYWDFDEAERFYAELTQKAVAGEIAGRDIALLGCNDRYFLLTRLCRRKDAIHPWIYDRLREVEASPDGHLDLWARYHYKSTSITFAGVIQEILCDPEIRVGIFSNTKEIAHPFVAQIKEEFEGNEQLMHLYPDVLWQSSAERKAGARSWSIDGGITVKRQGNPREATVEGHGLIEALPTGKHFNLLVYDDVINERNVTNPEQVKKATERMELSFNLGVGEGTRKWFIGTRYHFSDTYAYILEHQIASPRIKPATSDGSIKGVPVFLSPDAWEKVKREQRSSLAAQMLQNPRAGQENTFETRWLKPFWERPAMLNVYIMGDPSRGHNATSDRTAIPVVGIDPLNNKYFLDGYCHRMQLRERWERLRDLYKKWSAMPGVQLVKVGWERYGMQSDDDYFQERQRAEQYFFPIETLSWTGERGGESKKYRVERLEPDFREGSFFVPGRVWHPAIGNEHNWARWYLEDGSDEIKYRPCPGLHARERAAKEAGALHRVFDPIRRVDEDGNIYDLTRVLFEEYALFPFSTRDDLIDATSRIYDMDPQPAVLFEQGEPESYPDD